MYLEVPLPQTARKLLTKCLGGTYGYLAFVRNRLARSSSVLPGSPQMTGMNYEFDLKVYNG
jgi:hypothetical protein